ncbi:aminotransferase class I/II-fold pyridoxal phosphate-dependent enzyme [Parvibacter caecicola]|uniref:aminotransferase class I/II-fold pyridoxal phosphate-dependent enzyme n=1 Tax=Parvibacter caecicola TaxID=747645 RepID=UPI003C6DD573
MKQADLIRLASEMGVKLGKSQVSQYVSGKTAPRKEVLFTLASILSVEPSWLQDGAGDPFAPGVISMAAAAAVQSEGRGSKFGSSSRSKFGSAENEPIVPPVHCATITSTPASPVAPTVPFPEQERDPLAAPLPPITKSTKLDNVLYDVRGPVAEEAARMEAAGTQILKLNIGNPAPFGFRTPDEVIYDMRTQLTDCEGYSDSKGLFSARKAIMQYAQIKGIPHVTIEDVYTGNGVSELINISLSALLDNGDEVLVPSPDYPLWTACVNLAGGTAVHYICDEQAEWNPDLDDIRSKITPRTKAIVVINPNNPTGALYSREVLEGIVEIARQHGLIVFSDEIYDRLVMDGFEHISTASLAPDLFCVTFSGLSKSHMVAGYRIGWMILSGPKWRAKDYILGLNMLCNMRMCSNVPAQSIVQTALGGHQSVNGYIAPGGRVYEQRDFVYEALNAIPGVTAVKPKAGFYIFPKLDVKRFNITDDEQFALDLLHDQKVLISHGGAFNWKQPDHFRVVFLPRVEVLEETMDKLAQFLATYRQ